MTSGSGDRLRKEGSYGGGVYSFFPCPSRSKSDYSSVDDVRRHKFSKISLIYGTAHLEPLLSAGLGP